MSTGIDAQNFVEAVADSSSTAVGDINPALTATTPTPPQTEAPRFEAFTAEAIEKAREQEKAKLYPQIDKMKEEIAALRREKEEREAAEAKARAEAEAEARRLAEEEMSVRELLQKKEQEWNERLEQERVERERALALLDQERMYQELQAYKVNRIEAERDNIMPELLDLVTGNTPEEVEASIESLKDRTNRILESAQQAMSSARRDMVGTRTTIPAAGPLDTNTDNKQFTPEDIANMSMSDYQKYRSRLLSGNAQGNNRGLFG
jgi:DNA repair exonuclease SbcCD ATPase subunit